MLADFDAEKAVCGHVLDNGMHEDARTLRPEDFGTPACAEAWRSVLRVDGKRQPVDYLTVAEDMRTRGVFADVGGHVFLASLQGLLTFSLAAQVAIVRDRAQRRAAIAAAELCRARAHDLNLKPEAVALEASAQLAQLGAATQARTTTFRDAMNEFIDRMDAIRNGTGSQYVRTGIGVWDELLGGLCKGQLILLGAYPSVGKGAVIGRACLNIAQRGEVVHLQSLEDPKIWLAKRYVARESGIPVRRLMQAERLSEYAEEAINSAVMGCHDWADNIIFDDRAPLTDDQVAAAVRQSVVQRGATAAFIDNASEVDLEGGGERYDLRTARMVGLFRNVAKDLNIPVVLAVHFKRPKGNVTKEPRFIRPTSDLFKNSGAFEEKARVAVALWLNEEDPKSEVIGTVIKQTEGEKDFDFAMRMGSSSGLVENTGGRKLENFNGYTEAEQ